MPVAGGPLTMPEAVIRHLYVHVPFCRHRCGYCDFYSLAGATEKMEPYVAALLDELGAQRTLLAPLATIYLGGGTPTLLGGRLLEELLGHLTALALPDCEVTVEANPETVSAELAVSLGRSGVNRVSLGAQSFSVQLRAALERTGSPASVAAAVRILREAGIDNISVDLIYGIPGQGMDELKDDLEAALALRPEHISCYELTVKEGSVFARRHAAALVGVKTQGREFYEAVADTLEGAGYRWYETSNFALPGRECRHNIAYWQGEDYLGLGAGAWSTAGGRRWQNPEDLEAWMGGEEQRQRSRRVEILSEQDRANERLALGLRLAGGVEIREVAAVVDTGEAERLRHHGYMTIEGDKISLTREGRFVANEVCVRLMKD